jgi:hypothetical protein
VAAAKHIALNLLRSTNANAKLKVRRKKAAWNTTYLKPSAPRRRPKILKRFP